MYLIVSCERTSIFVIWAENQLLHYAFNSWIDVSRHITRAQVPSYEFIGYRNNKSKVRSNAESKNGKLMSLKRILINKKFNFFFTSEMFWKTKINLYKILRKYIENKYYMQTQIKEIARKISWLPKFSNKKNFPKMFSKNFYLKLKRKIL